MNDIIDLNLQNIDKEHICCSLSDKKGQCGVSSKKEWLKARFQDGLVFKKLNARGKVFIEYIPAEKAWSPIDANDYMFINCFWVSGNFKGKGYGKELLLQCIDDSKSKGKKGIVVVSSNKKKSFLSDKKYLSKFGFVVCDKAEPYFELLCLKFDDNADSPKFKENAKLASLSDQRGLIIYYSHQCPFCADYVGIAVNTAKKLGVEVLAKKYECFEEAKNAPCAVTTYSVFYNGKFVTNEILTEKKVEAILNA